MDAVYSMLDPWLGLSTQSEHLRVSQMLLRAVIVFIAGIVMLRVGHKRFFARSNAMDVLLTFVLASTLARAINGGAAFFPTLGTGFGLVFLHRGLTWVGARFRVFDRVLKGAPVTLIRDGAVDETVLRRHDLSHQDLAEDLRIRGVGDASAVRLATLERNGQVSILKAE